MEITKDIAASISFRLIYGAVGFCDFIHRYSLFYTIENRFRYQMQVFCVGDIREQHHKLITSDNFNYRLTGFQ